MVFLGYGAAWSVAPNFDYRELANQMEKMITSLPTYKKAAANYKFKTWDEVCSSWIEDVKREA